MVTRKDVALRANVSTSTVSRVLNGNKHVSEKAKIKVLKAIDELQYVPNQAARGLRTKRYKQFACITPSITNSFFSEILAGIEERSLEKGYALSLYKIAAEKETLDILRQNLYDGLIILAPFKLREIISLEELAKRYPLSLYWDREEEISIPHVYIDLKLSMEKAVKYLISHGHTKIVFLGHKYHNISENPRYLGYLKAMKENNLHVENYFINLFENYGDTLTEGYLQVKRLLDNDLSFSAVAASNDLLAAGAMRAITKSGKKVATDISVIGMDNIELSNMITPPLTTINIPKYEIGVALVNQLLDQIGGKQQFNKIVKFNVNLIERESVAIVGVIS